MDCSIIIVNYKSAGLLANCLQTVYAQTSGIVYEVIVVDNASGDDSQLLIQARFPQVQWIQMNYNAGFARANNAGIRVANGKTVLLLNADTLVRGNAIGYCCQFLSGSGYAAAGVQLLNTDGSPQISGNYAMRGGLNYLLPLPYLGNVIKGVGNMLSVRKPNVPDANETINVDWINGAFLMVKRQAIEQAGLLDEDFFLYAEEAEWCSRLRKAGPLCILGQEKVTHLQGTIANTAFESSGSGYYNLFDRKGLQIMVSNFVRIRKEFGLGWFLLDLCMYVAALLVFPVALVADKIMNGRKARFTWTQVAGFAGNMARLLSLSPRIIANKPYFYKVL